MHRRLTILSVLAAATLAVALLAAGCSKPSGSRTTPAQGTSAPTSATTSPSAAATGQAVPVPGRPSHGPTSAPAPTAYFLQGEHLAAVTVPMRPFDTAVAGAALKALLAGPSPDVKTAGLTSAIPAGTRLLGLTISGGTATVDLSGRFGSGGGSASMRMRVAQVVWTLTQFPSTERVVFRMDGKPVEALGGEGLILSEPQTRDAWEDLAPPVLIDSPGVTDRVTSPIRVRGTANVFEAVFILKLLDSHGRPMASKTIHATAGTGTRGTFSATFVYDTSTERPAAVAAYVTSAKDGMVKNVALVPITLLPKVAR
jgi:germination protein M